MSKYPNYTSISAKVIAKSINENGTVITTFELDYPRYIHAEVMTHRVFSRNAQSSRAVPVANTLQINQDFVRPIVYGANIPGMSSKESLQGFELAQVAGIWEAEAKHAFEVSKQLADLGLHKQWANRITEPYSKIKVVLTTTEKDNFYWLRIDEDAAQPEIVELAQRMKEADEAVLPVKLDKGMWHLPYVEFAYNIEVDDNVSQIFIDSNEKRLKLKDAIKISASCCAQVSYRRLDDSLEKALSIYDKLFSGPKPHLSPTEHQAKVGSKHMDFRTKGITHIDRNGTAWSGNLRDYIQYRQLL